MGEEPKLSTVRKMSNMSDEDKEATLKAAKGGTWYEGWAPYCMCCNLIPASSRMAKKDYGFECQGCGNMIGWDCRRLAESPLNKLNKDQLKELAQRSRYGQG